MVLCALVIVLIWKYSSKLIFSTGCLVLCACLIYPFGWSDPKVKELCKSNAYNSGDCLINWAFILALIESTASISLSMCVYFFTSSSRFFASNEFFSSLNSFLNQSPNHQIKLTRRVDSNVTKLDDTPMKNYGFVFNIN